LENIQNWYRNFYTGVVLLWTFNVQITHINHYKIYTKVTATRTVFYTNQETQANWAVWNTTVNVEPVYSNNRNIQPVALWTQSWHLVLRKEGIAKSLYFILILTMMKQKSAKQPYPDNHSLQLMYFNTLHQLNNTSQWVCCAQHVWNNMPLRAWAYA